MLQRYFRQGGIKAIHTLHRGRKGPFNTFSKNIFSKRVSLHRLKLDREFKFYAWIIIYTANVYRDLRGLCGEIGVQGFQNCRVYMYVCIQHKQCRCAVYGFCGETISPKSVCNTVQIMWVSHIKLTGKPCIVLIFQQFQLISSEFVGISL